MTSDRDGSAGTAGASIVFNVDVETALAGCGEETLRRMALVAEFRTSDAVRHIERVSSYAGLLAELHLGDPERAELIRLASAAHDVGMIGVPDGVVRKAGRLTEYEYSLVKAHPSIGHEILSGSGSPLLDLAASIALTHHERFDGHGYPHGALGGDIPIEGRITLVADVFDALTTERAYRPAFRLDRALEMMRAESAAWFDPTLLSLFFEAMPQVLRLRASLGAEPVDV